MGQTLTRALLTERLAQKSGLSKSDIDNLTESFFEEIILALEAGSPVKLSSFGNFNLIDKASRPGRNPKTGEEIPITARRVVTFKAGNKLKKGIEEEISSSNGKEKDEKEKDEG